MAFGQDDGWEWETPRRTLPEMDRRTTVIRAYTAIGMGLLALASLGGWYLGWLPVACAYSAVFYFSVRACDDDTHDATPDETRTH